MPLLKREPDLQPENLFALDLPWGVAHVRSRQEKLLARHLVQHGVAFYLPLSEIRKRRAGRTFRSWLPLFPGYVFFRLEPERRDVLWRSNVLANLIDVPDQERLGEELAQLRRLQESGATLHALDEVVVGDPVRISEGAFRGYTGVVTREKGKDRLIVQISLLRQAVAVEFDREMVSRER